MSAKKRYIVIVYPAPPAMRGTDPVVFSQSTSERKGPKVTDITADSEQAAAASVGVPPGAHALVIEKAKARRFDRAPQAPLEEKSPDGTEIDRAA